ncbi:HAMP domain-containing histidine kinase [Actinoallomurus purpureus]|uniref:sensor histidine kinase n=1 Tax=Actinoallomurus purpureus TaxID=478114 RepID=UPI0020923CC7|nr:HAMP domain-containing sensor histidine kinase [Actinoallomurus purpureus]MCO6010023.1 HAMP domain-containing histidine kinase [Actinoallomurus purpureus]
MTRHRVLRRRIRVPLGRLRVRTLRGRLIVGSLLLFTLACGIVSVVTALSLRGFLIGRLDQQLQDAKGRYAIGLEHAVEREHFDKVNGQSVGTFGARLADGRITQCGVVRDPRDPGGELTLAAADRTRLKTLPADGRARTVVLEALGKYRITANPGEDHDVLVTGLPMHGVDEVVGRLEMVEVAVFGVVLVGGGVAGATFIRLSLRPLRRVAATAMHVSELPLASGEVVLPARVPDTETGTEVGQVSTAFNHMLEHVESALAQRHASEGRLRRFIADASHELRTPLASIRSHAELARRDPGETGPRIDHALRRIEAEAARMGHLVDDLLLLARLDAGRPLAHEPVDLTRLAIDTTSDARAAGSDHHWALDLPEDPVTVHGDEFRLHQVIGNLLTNARTHTPPGTNVTVRVGAAGADGTVLLEVIDDGPGIPAELRDDVFERFVRGDGSRSRKAGGTGLGLAIVSAVVHAHGGSVDLVTEPGRTCFRIRLPVGSPDQKPPEPGPE